jgi:hypothetical protein
MTLCHGAERLVTGHLQKCLEFSYVVVDVAPPARHVVRSPIDNFEFVARQLFQRFDYDGVDQHVAILVADRSFIASTEAPGCSS